MSETDFDAFVDDIRINGQLVPIWVRGSEVIDGRKRLAACQRLGIEPKIVNLSPDQDAGAVARALNVLRTHYAPSQLAIYAATRANATKTDAVAMRRDRNYNGKNTVVTVLDAAREVGISQSTVGKAKRVLAEGAPEVAAAVKAGRLTLHAATEIITSVPREEQPAIVERVVEASKGKVRHTPVARVLDATSDTRRDRAMPKPAHEQFARAVQSMEVLAEVIAKNADAAAQDARRKSLVEALRDIRTTLTRAINTMEIAA